MLDNLSDVQLADGLRGEPEAFALVYDRYFRDIYRYVAGRLDVQAADDIAADVFLAAYQARDSFDPGRGALRPWLFGIATNLVARHRRKELRHYRALARADPPGDAPGHEDRVVDAVAAAKLQPLLAKALTTLNHGERDVITLSALAQLGHAEIAEALDIPYGTVGSRLSRARTKLRTALEDR